MPSMTGFIKAPSQARSRDTMNRIYKSLGELLQTKPFDKITIANLAEDAGVATGSIYARFQDKNALIAGLHKHISEEAAKCFLQFTTPSKWEDVETGAMITSILSRVIGFYRRKHHILRAAVLADLPYIYDTMTGVWQAAVARMLELLSPRMSGSSSKYREDAVRFSIRIVTSMMHQSIVLRDVRALHVGSDDRVLIRNLTAIICAYLEEVGLEPAPSRGVVPIRATS
jgi:AcrR family transcriptional regulator